jgi:recombination protein RecT
MSQLATLKTFLGAREKALAAFCKQIDPGMMIRIALRSASRDRKLLQCTPESLYVALTYAAQVGLDPSGLGNEAALVPYMNRKLGKYEAQFQPMYAGLCTLVIRAKIASYIAGFAVYEKDKFVLEYGAKAEDTVRHRPCLNGDPGELQCAWAKAVLREGHVKIEHMTMRDVLSIKSAVLKRAGEHYNGPWVGPHEGEMWKKSVIKRLLKPLPKSRELSLAVNLDNRVEGSDEDLQAVEGDVIDQEKEVLKQIEDVPVGEQISQEQLKTASIPEAGRIEIRTGAQQETMRVWDAPIPHPREAGASQIIVETPVFQPKTEAAVEQIKKKRSKPAQEEAETVRSAPPPAATKDILASSVNRIVSENALETLKKITSGLDKANDDEIRVRFSLAKSLLGEEQTASAIRGIGLTHKADLEGLGAFGQKRFIANALVVVEGKRDA